MDFYKILYRTGVHHVFRTMLKGKTLTVLSLHRISEEYNYFWNPISPSVFDQLCRYVAKYYQVITFNQIENYRDAKKPLLILSFDDGYYDFMENAMPILSKYSLPANQNIVYECAENNMAIWTQRLNAVFQYLFSNKINDASLLLENNVTASLAAYGGNWRSFYNNVYIGLVKQQQAGRELILAAFEQKHGIYSNEKMLNWNDIASLIREGIEIGNHTWSHDAIATIEDPQFMHKEIISSKLKLEEKLQIPISIFSLPNGETKPRLSEKIKAAGYKYVLELNNRTNRLAQLGKGNNIYNRITIGDEPTERMILRTETFHSTLHKFLR